MSSSKPRKVGEAFTPEELAAGAKPAGAAGTGAAQAPGATGGAPSNPYARFIPREELGAFAAWSPGEFSNDGAAGGRGAAAGPGGVAGGAAQPEARSRGPGVGKPQPARDPKVVAAEIEERVKAARQGGYQDGYRDGLAALENFKQSYSAQLSQQLGGQVGALAEQFHARLDALEQQLAGRMAGVALDLARQVVRSEISLRPELVVEVAEEALGALLASARHVVVKLHPDDQAVVGHSLKDMLHARGAKLLVDAGVTRGGVVIESDIAVVDASVEARWRKTAALLGSRDEWSDHPWRDDDAPEAPDKTVRGSSGGDAP